MPGHGLFRVHALDRHPLFLGPPPRDPPTGRWDSPDGRFRTFYVADGANPCIAVAERFLRDPERTLVPESELRRAAVSLVRVESQIGVVPFHGAALKQLGASAAVAHGDHRESRLWALAIHDHPGEPAGVRWRSRIDDDDFALALFDRSRAALKVVVTKPLLDAGSLFDLEACLERYAAAVVAAAGG